MILKHPLNTKNEENKEAIRKYADRKVYIWHGKFQMWMQEPVIGIHWGSKKDRKEFTFKEALKLTKHYYNDSLIEYHFISSPIIGENNFDIKDFQSDEDIFICPNFITFENSHTKQASL